MKRLYISIIISVLSALFLINLGVDQLASNNITPDEQTDIVLYKKLINGFSAELDLVPTNKLQQQVQQQANRYQVTLTMQHVANLALPDLLEPQLSQPGGLLLGSDSETFLLKQLNNHPDILIQLLIPTTQEAPKNIDLILTTLLYLGVCFVIILWLFPLTRRLYLLTQTAAKIGEGDLQARLPTSRFSYIQPLENSFNRMAAQIETLVADNKILARSLSHDIRTPLACLRFGVEAALDAQNVDKKNTYINRMDAEITRMEDMTSTFLEYAALERKGLNVNLTPTDLTLLVKRLTEDFASLAEQHNINIKFQLDLHYSLAQVDPHWCYLAIQNIVANAVRYAKTQVLITVQEDKKGMKVIVEDDGDGIPESQLEQIFRPFVKLAEDRSREEGHFGLGLATTVKVMDWHQGSIHAENSPNLSGLRCTLTFNKANT